MSFNLVTSYPWWFLILCPLAGFLAAGILYFIDLKKEKEGKTLLRILFAFRFLSVTLLVFLLFGPFIRTSIREVEKPVIVFALDESESVVIGKDSGYYKNEFRQGVNELLEKLKEEYDVQSYSFGSELKEGNEWTFNDKETDFTGLFSELEARYNNRNLGAVIIASDGIYNKGTNPVFSSNRLKAPLYTIALGDTNPRKDIFISRVAVNKIAYLGNTFPLQVFAEARKCKGNTVSLSVSKEGKKLYSTLITITNDHFTIPVKLQLDADKVGVQRYTISIQSVPGELSLKNNVRDVFIEVLDSREKILILGKAPHPDLGALKEAIETSQTYQADIVLADEPFPKIKKYNLVILHSLPAGNNVPANFESVKSSGIPLLFISGNGSDMNALSAGGTGVSIAEFRGRFNESQALMNKDFSLFTTSDELQKRIEKFPPLSVPFASFRTSAGVNVLAYQKIGMVETKDPLISFTESNGVRYGLISGEGLWRWRLADFAMNGDHAAFNELAGKLVQFMSSKVNKSQFRVNVKNSFAENESVEFEAELYNESFEPVNDIDVSLDIYNMDGKKYPFTFSKTSDAYHLNAGTFPPGEYRYVAGVKERKLTASGKFLVTPLIAEQTITVADHLMLNNLAESKGGRMYHPVSLDSLYSDLTARKDITSVSYIQTSMKELIDQRWLFLVILLLFSIEWFIRKYYGKY